LKSWIGRHTTSVIVVPAIAVQPPPFLLVQNGFNASVLNGGVQVMAQDLVTE